jgi:hypothetical protein
VIWLSFYEVRRLVSASIDSSGATAVHPLFAILRLPSPLSPRLHDRAAASESGSNTLQPLILIRGVAPMFETGWIRLHRWSSFAASSPLRLVESSVSISSNCIDLFFCNRLGLAVGSVRPDRLGHRLSLAPLVGFVSWLGSTGLSLAETTRFR